MRTWRWFILFLVVAGLMVEILYDPLSWVVNEMRIMQYRRELPLARARWQKAGLVDYRIDVRGGIPLNCIVAVRLITRQGELVELQRLSLQRNLPPEALCVQLDAEYEGCKYAEFAIPQVIDELAELLKHIDPARSELKIIFDSQYGYVRHYEVNNYYRMGLLTPGVGECCRKFDFENFDDLQ